MSKFALIRNLKLDHYGDEWKDCYLRFREPTVPELLSIQDLSGDDLKESSEKMLEVYKSCFIEGKMFDGKAVVAVEKSDLTIDNLPYSIIKDVSYFLLSGRTLREISQESKKKPS